MTNKNLNADLPDSEKDKAKMQPEDTILDLPDVKDIPGQENIHVPGLGELADTTISSDDEEGVGIFDDPDEDLSSERLGPASIISEDDLIIKDEELEEQLDKDEDIPQDEDLYVTDDVADEDADVTKEEKEALERTENMDTQDNENLYRAELDDEDFDGEKLNEDEDFSGDNLDVPGGEEDDASEEIGAEDEENNSYSLGDNEK